jgi:NAD(P)-dependent dehydrogenase (short-subunit alcohol dehydrogenase family)
LFTKAVALKGSKAGPNYNIRVNSVHLDVMETLLVATMAQDKAVKERLENSRPMGFTGKPIDVAYAVLYLASDESRPVTGAKMVIDGGRTAR